jgi:predicted nucleic acid-binding protein
MEPEPTFIDSVAFHSFFDRSDRWHEEAKAAVAERARLGPLHTSSLVVQEAATLMKARGLFSAVPKFFEFLDRSSIRTRFIDESDFEETKRFLLRHGDKPWSFVDCSSFVLMRRMGLRHALTADRHFEQAGFVALLSPS